MKKTDIKSLTLPGLLTETRTMGQPDFRGNQIFKWLHQKYACDFDVMSDLPLSFREECDKKFYISSLNIKKRLVSSMDGTVKYLYGLSDGNTVETVLMRYRHGNRLCISTQAGCRMGCSFCASGENGLARNLMPGEMLEEVYAVSREEKISGVVLMGIGEPLDNFDNVLTFLEILSSPQGMGMSLRHVSLSTCGLVDQIYMLAQKKLGLTLSVSLHAPNDEIRRSIMPVGRRWPMDELLAACKHYFDLTGRRVSFEYALIGGVNDKETHARELGGKLRGTNCHVNLIPVNDVAQGKYRAGKKESTERFAGILENFGVNATIRRTLGADIEAACGQLRRRDRLEAGHDSSSAQAIKFVHNL